MEFIKQKWLVFLIASLTLGLAPFNSPHIFGKLKWIMVGSAFVGNQAISLLDWFDVLLHGTPWVLLLSFLHLNITSWFLRCR